MQDDASMVVDRGQHQDAMTPWEQEAWRDAALGWVERELSARGLGERGQRTVRLRPWSVLVRIPVEDHSTVWFKANPPASAFEAVLTKALACWVPQYVLEPLAVDADQGWSLLPDGGELFCDVLDRGPADPRAWEEPLRRYANMQRELMAKTREIELLGVPSARTPELPDTFDRVMAGAALSPDDLRGLRELRPRLVDWSTELAGVGIADSLDHADLHEAQVFNPEPGQFKFFDWGDAAVSHPFCSFLVPARTARERYGPDVLPRLRDAYLEPWTEGGRTTAELRRAVTLAWRLGAIGRACSWGRIFPEASETAIAASASATAAWLLKLFDEPPL